jgi:hypothetical protein
MASVGGRKGDVGLVARLMISRAFPGKLRCDAPVTDVSELRNTGSNKKVGRFSPSILQC